MHDLADDPDRQSKYECLQCGNIVVADTHPGDCEECGGVVQDRAKSLE